MENSLHPSRSSPPGSSLYIVLRCSPRSCGPMLLTSVLLPGRKIIPPSVQILHTLNDGLVSGDAAGCSKASPRETEDGAAKWAADG
jgi:hypothetical protein